MRASAHALVVAIFVGLFAGLFAALSACGGSSPATICGPGDAGQSSDADGGPDVADAPSEPDGDSSDGALDVGQNEDGPRSLFDGASLASWQTYLGPPSSGAAPLGLDNDPRGVFTVVTVDGEPAIRVSGEVWGALISRETFCNFRLRAQYKWGQRIWPGLGFRDSGLMYLSTGPYGAVNAGGPTLSSPPGTGAYMVSVEFQISPSDVGSIPALGPIDVKTLSRTVPVELGGWNQVEIVVQNGAVTHLFNGVEVARGQGFTLEWPGQAPTPLACGRLQIECEGSEIYFRHLEIERLP
jgi:hypothetical protein